MGSHKKTSLLLIASIALLTFVIILLARFRTDSVPAPAGQAKIEAQTAKPTGEPEVVAKSPEAKVDQASTRVKIARSYKSKEKQASDSDDEGETELVLKRNGKEVRIKQDADRRPGARTDEPAEAMQAYLQKRLPKGATELPVERYFTAREKIRNMQQFSTPTNQLMPPESVMEKDRDSPADPLIAWSELGPGNVGGRTRALIINPANASIMYSAGVAGGVWKTTDGGATWVPLDDFMANIAVTCLAFEPGNPNVIYAGTGEGFFNADGVRGAGIFKSINAGGIWTRLPFTANNVDFQFVNDIVVSNVNVQHLYAATRSGVLRSLDGGTTWSLVLSVPAVGPSTTGVRGAMDLVMRTDQATDYIFAAAGTAFSAGEPQSHIFRNNDAGGAGTWDDVYTEATMGRTSLAIAPSNQSVIYALSDSTEASNYNLGLLGVFRSASSGDVGSWTTQVRNTSVNKQDTLLLSNPINAALVECGFGPTNNFLNQGWYDNVIAVDPTDANKVWVGGIDTWRSDNAGVNWGVSSYWWFQGNGTPPNNGDPQLVHADNHVIVFHPNYNGDNNQTMFVGDDGGIYKTDNAKTGNVGYVSGITPSGGTITATSPICGNEFTPGGFFTVPSPVIWGPLNNKFAVTQFYHGAVYPDGMTYFGGTQDNGTNRGTDAGGANSWERILGGDGGYVAVDPSDTNVLYAENTGNTFQKSTNGGASFAAARTGIAGDTFPFTSVFRIDPNNSARLWYAGRFMWRTDNSAGVWTRTSNTQQTGTSITAIAIATGDSDTVIDGAASGQIRRTTVGTTATSASPLATTWLQSFTPRGNGFGGISWVEYAPTNKLIVYATVSNFNSASSGDGFGHVFKSSDGGATWALADGNQTPANPNAIPDIPAHSIAIDEANANRVYVGTDLGIFVTLDGGANWLKESGFPNVVTETLTLNKIAGQPYVFAFTHGRGVFRSLLSIPTAAPATISGKIATSDGQALAGVSVSLSGGNVARTITDSNGEYRFNDLEVGQFYTITPGLVNYHFGPETRSFSLLANTTEATFTAMRDAVISGNPIDTPDYFVRQHYLDFLGREPDASGFNFWSDQITSCGTDAACVERRKINVSAAYFLSIEFQNTGVLVDSVYRASYGRRPMFTEFMPDTAQVARNVIVGQTDWARILEENKRAFIDAWVQRPAFQSAYGGLTSAAYVDALISHTGVSFSQSERDALVNGLTSGTATRAEVLRQIAENERFVAAKRNEQFVMMQYFGYLRREPDADGYAFWLNKLNQFNGNFEQAEMVKAFLVSGEYRSRFGQ